MFSISSSSNIDSDSSISSTADKSFSDSYPIASDLSSSMILSATRKQIDNNYQYLYQQQYQHIKSPPSKSPFPKEMMSSQGNLASYSGSDMYPMYQCNQVTRRHSTVDSSNSTDLDFKKHHVSLYAPVASQSENMPINPNYYMQASGKPHQALGPDPFQSFHPIKIANNCSNSGQTPFYAESNSLLSLPKKISLYKTELCRTFEETGFCRYGIKCQFAHDKSELRIIPRHPRYKTEICRTFWELGNCPYGKRCCFIHLEAGTLIDGKPPGEAKISTDHQFNGSVSGGFHKDQLTKSAMDSMHPIFSEPKEDHTTPTAFHSVSGSGCLSAQEPHVSSSPGFDWMRTRRSQSLSLPSPSGSVWGINQQDPTFRLSSASKELPSLFPYDASVPIVENNDYVCENCSKDKLNTSSPQHKFSSCKLSAYGSDGTCHSCAFNLEDESTESLIADSLLASLPDI